MPYDGSLRFGVTGDYDTAPDIRILCKGIEVGMAELARAARRAPSTPRRRRTSRPPTTRLPTA